MLAIATGWKLLGTALLVLFATGVIGLVTYDARSPRLRIVRRTAGALAVLAGLVIVSIVILGPGAWCEQGDAYHVPGCA